MLLYTIGKWRIRAITWTGPTNKLCFFDLQSRPAPPMIRSQRFSFYPNIDSEFRFMLRCGYIEKGVRLV